MADAFSRIFVNHGNTPESHSCIQSVMKPRAPEDEERCHGSRAMVLVILSIVVVSFLAFLILRPNPGSSNGNTPPPSTQR